MNTILSAEEMLQMHHTLLKELSELKALINSFSINSMKKELPAKEFITINEAAEVFDMSTDGFRRLLEQGYITVEFFIPEGFTAKLVCRKDELYDFIAEKFGKPGKLVAKHKALTKAGLGRNAKLPIKFIKPHPKMRFEFCLESDFNAFIKLSA